MRNTLKLISLAVLAAIAALPMTAQAHRSWLKPSAVQVEGKAQWVTIDAATSEGIFDFDSFPLKLDGLTVIGPDGQPAAFEAPVTGHLRSTFDLQLNAPGTYRVTVANAAVMGSYVQAGETKRFRSPEADLAKTVPADATDVKLSRMYNRFDTFVTAGKGNDTALQPTGKGLEMVPVTHPSDLVLGEPATFKFLLDGKPLANLGVTVIPGGARFRNALKETVVTTDANGIATVNWTQAGNFLLTANYPPRPQKPEGEGSATDMPAQRYPYTATFEVLPN